MPTIIQGDCLEELKRIGGNSIDAIVTDPPYGLSFMGNKWDYDVPSMEIWKECFRVLKPGGYLLAFAGTRTQHRMAVRIEDSGFEIRDMIAWVYGSGFPKSLNIGKAVDKIQGNEREDLGHNPSARTNKPDVDVYEAGIRGKDCNLTKGNSEWEGWGTALKPALEPITVARKPLSEKTVALNCLKWAVGGINIDGCRVGTEKLPEQKAGQAQIGTFERDNMVTPERFGRFPANLIHDGSCEVLSLFPECKQAKNVGDFKQLEQMRFSAGGVGVKKQKQTNGEIITASAARFFYCSKASRGERNINGANNNHATVKPIKLMEYLVKLVSRDGATILDPFAGSGTTGLACQKLGREYILIERELQYVEIIKARLCIK